MFTAYLYHTWSYSRSNRGGMHTHSRNSSILCLIERSKHSAEYTRNRTFYFTISRFFHRKFLRLHLRHLTAVAALRAPQSLQIFTKSLRFCAIAFLMGSVIGKSQTHPRRYVSHQAHKYTFPTQPQTIRNDSKNKKCI